MQPDFRMLNAQAPSNATRREAVRSAGRREIELDVTRGVAILLAMGWHFNELRTGFPPIDWLMAPGRLFGWAGVDLFFVLSGFLVGRLIFVEYEATGSFQARRFLVRRALKIWPILYVFLFCQLIVGFKPWQEYFFQVGFHLQNFLKTPILHLWSLAVEEHFYLIFAGLFAVYEKRHDINFPNILCPILGILIAAPILRSLAVFLTVDPISIQWQTQYRIDALSCGVALAALSVFRSDIFQKLLKPKWLYLCITLLGCGSLSYQTFHGAFNSIVGYTIAYISAASFLLLCYKNQYLLNHRKLFLPIATIGVYSYAMYIWHPGMIRVSDALSRYLPDGPLENTILLLSRYASAIVIAVVMTKAIERPFLAIRDRIFPRSDGRREVRLQMSNSPPADKAL